MHGRMPRREFLQGLGAAGATAAAALPSIPGCASMDSPMKSPFRIAVINDEIGQDFGHVCELAAKGFQSDQVRCLDFWRLDDQGPYRAAINEKLRNAAEKGAKKDAILVLENEPACNTATAAEAAKVLAAVTTSNLMLNWDPGNAA